MHRQAEAQAHFFFFLSAANHFSGRPVVGFTETEQANHCLWGQRDELESSCAHCFLTVCREIMLALFTLPELCKGDAVLTLLPLIDSGVNSTPVWLLRTFSLLFSTHHLKVSVCIGIRLEYHSIEVQEAEQFS